MFYTREQVGEMMMLNPLAKVLRRSSKPDWYGKRAPAGFLLSRAALWHGWSTGSIKPFKDFHKADHSIIDRAAGVIFGFALLTFIVWAWRAALGF